jgi:hypothetical protein
MIRFLRRLLGFREKKPSLLAYSISAFSGHKLERDRD